MNDTASADLRELNRQALDTARSAVVSACAGSGKTWLLVSRIVRLLLEGAEPSQILAITFTRKAAQEMAARLREWLRFLASEDEASVRAFLQQRELPSERIDRLLARARELFELTLIADPPLTITTFHSWFLQLLRNAPLEAGAFGAVTLVDRTATLVDEAWERLMRTCKQAPASAAALGIQALFRDFGLDNTRRLLRNFITHRAEWWAFAGARTDAVAFALDRIAGRLSVTPDSAVLDALLSDRSFAADVRSLMRLLERNGVVTRKLAENVFQALAGASSQAAFDAIRKAVLTEEGKPRSYLVTRELLDFAGADAGRELQRLHVAVQVRVQEAQTALADQAMYRANAAGIAAGVALLEHFQDVKRERQVVDFADVEWLAFSLLARQEHAITMQFRLDSRYRHILLDEFQDTNPLQWLALQAWFDASAQAEEPPLLFLVGDPKQSIYRFRRAEPELFEAAMRFVEQQGGISVSQDESFRCAPPVLDAVNHVFAQQPLFVPFNAHAAHHKALPGRVEVQPLARRAPAAADSAAGERSVLRNPLVEPIAIAEDLRRATEAHTFASRIREIVATWIVTEAGGRTARRARFADIMALVRRRTHLAVYERALRSANIPYVTSRQGGLLDTLEAEDLSALLQFLVAPFDDLKLAHTLRSPIFALTDDDLMAIAATPGKTWWERLERRAASEESQAMARAASLLSRWRERADTQPVHDQLDRIYHEGDVMRRYDAAVPDAMRGAVAANLNAYIQHALDTDSGRYPSLPRFIAELRELRAAPVDEAPDEGILGAYGDSLRIMTVHGAKGLESPIVWLLDAAAAPMPDTGYDALIEWPPGAAAPTSFSLRTRLREQSAEQRRLAQAEAERAQREDLNLLYVAMTRARQALIVSGCEMRAAASSWYTLVRAAVSQLVGDGEEDASTTLAYGDDLSGPEAVSGMVSAAGSEVPAATPSLLALPTVLPTGTRNAGVQGRGQAYGTAFHRVMERLVMEPTRSAESMRRQLRVPQRDFDALWSQARAVLADPALARFFVPTLHQRAFNELPIVTAAGELRRLDRVVEFHDQVWVLDYKTGSLANVVGTALEAEYRAQIEDYCAALARVYADRPVRGALLFADGSRIDV